MPIFLRPDRGTTVSKHIHDELNEGVVKLQYASDKYCLSLNVEDFTKVLFDKDGEPIKDGILKSGQRAKLDLGRISADKYHLMLIPNPELARMAYIGGPILMEPYESERLDYMLKVERGIELAKLSYLFRIYLVD